MNPSWNLWIHASLLTYFTTFFKNDPTGLFLQVEGQDRLTAGKPDWAELRWDGPFVRPWSAGTHYIDVDVNFLISSTVSRDDTYKHKKLVGLVQSSIINTINVFKYGDDGKLLGCLQLRIDDRTPIGTNYFGQIQADVLMEQSTVEACYRMILDT